MDEETKRLIDYQGECSAAFRRDREAQKPKLSTEEVEERVDHIFKNANPEDGAAVIRAARVITENLSADQISRNDKFSELVEQAEIQGRVMAARGVAIGNKNAQS